MVEEIWVADKGMAVALMVDEGDRIRIHHRHLHHT